MLHLRRGASPKHGFRIVTITALTNLVVPYGLTRHLIDAAVAAGLQAGTYVNSRTSNFKNACMFRVPHRGATYAVKLFYNLRLQLTGLKDLETLEEVANIIAAQLTHAGVPTWLDSDKTKVCLVNYAMDTEMRIGLRHLKGAFDDNPHPQLRLTSFDSDKRQAVSIKFVVQGKLVSFSVFESGKLNISCPCISDFDEGLDEIYAIANTYVRSLISMQSFVNAFA